MMEYALWIACVAAIICAGIVVLVIVNRKAKILRTASILAVLSTALIAYAVFDALINFDGADYARTLILIGIALAFIVFFLAMVLLNRIKTAPHRRALRLQRKNSKVVPMRRKLGEEQPAPAEPEEAVSRQEPELAKETEAASETTEEKRPKQSIISASKLAKAADSEKDQNDGKRVKEAKGAVFVTTAIAKTEEKRKKQEKKAEKQRAKLEAAQAAAAQKEQRLREDRIAKEERSLAKASEMKRAEAEEVKAKLGKQSEKAEQQRRKLETTQAEKQIATEAEPPIQSVKWTEELPDTSRAESIAAVMDSKSEEQRRRKAEESQTAQQYGANEAQPRVGGIKWVEELPEASRTEPIATRMRSREEERQRRRLENVQAAEQRANAEPERRAGGIKWVEELPDASQAESIAARLRNRAEEDQRRMPEDAQASTWQEEGERDARILEEQSQQEAEPMVAADDVVAHWQFEEDESEIERQWARPEEVKQELPQHLQEDVWQPYDTLVEGTDASEDVEPEEAALLDQSDDEVQPEEWIEPDEEQVAKWQSDEIGVETMESEPEYEAAWHTDDRTTADETSEPEADGTKDDVAAYWQQDEIDRQESAPQTAEPAYMQEYEWHSDDVTQESDVPDEAALEEQYQEEEQPVVQTEEPIEHWQLASDEAEIEREWAPVPKEAEHLQQWVAQQQEEWQPYDALTQEPVAEPADEPEEVALDEQYQEEVQVEEAVESARTELPEAWQSDEVSAQDALPETAWTQTERTAESAWTQERAAEAVVSRSDTAEQSAWQQPEQMPEQAQEEAEQPTGVEHVEEQMEDAYRATVARKPMSENEMLYHKALQLKQQSLHQLAAGLLEKCYKQSREPFKTKVAQELFACYVHLKQIKRIGPVASYLQSDRSMANVQEKQKIAVIMKMLKKS